MVRMAQKEVHQLLDQVDQEEARAKNQVGKKLNLQLGSGQSKTFTGLRQDVQHGRSQKDPASKTQEKRCEQYLCSSGILGLYAKNLFTENKYCLKSIFSRNSDL